MGWVRGHYRRGGYVNGHYRHTGGGGGKAAVLLAGAVVVGIGYVLFAAVRASAPAIAGILRSAHSAGSAAVNRGRPRVRAAAVDASSAARAVTAEQWVLAAGALSLFFLGGLFATLWVGRPGHKIAASPPVVEARPTPRPPAVSPAAEGAASPATPPTFTGWPQRGRSTAAVEESSAEAAPEATEPPIAASARPEAVELCPEPRDSARPMRVVTVAVAPLSPKRPAKGTLTLNPIALRPVPLARDAVHLELWEAAEAKRNDGTKLLMVRNKSVVLVEEPDEVAVTIRLARYHIVEMTSGPFKGQTFVVNPIDLKQW